MRIVVAAAAVLVLTACGIPAESTPRAIPSSSISPSDQSSSPEVDSGPQAVDIFLVQQNGMLSPVERRLPRSPGPDQLLQSLLVGPQEQDLVDGYRSVAFAKARANERVPENNIVTVQLPPVEDANGEAAPTDQNLGYAQIVLTLTADASVDGVVFVRDGEQIQVPRGDLSFSPEGEPVTAADYATLVQEEPK